jgi:nicotinamide mononucleotide transporter
MMILGMSPLELSANVMTAVCIFLAGRNNVHTWWTGIVACVLFMVVFFNAHLYADVTLQLFFIATGVIGWWNWAISRKFDSFKNEKSIELAPTPLPITWASKSTMYKMSGIAILVAIGYGFLLHKFTNAYAPWIDSTVLTFSVVGQLLLMRRNIQNWPIWVLVNTLSVPLYFFRELYVTAVLYSFFWVNAIWSFKHWLDLMDGGKADTSPEGLAAIKKEVWG